MLTQPLPPPRIGALARLRGLVERRRPSHAQCTYDAAMEAGAAACEQIAHARDPWVRFLALCQLVSVHQVAGMVADEKPWPVHDGGDGRSVRQVHRDAGALLEWLAVTERTLGAQEMFDGEPLTSASGPLPLRWSDVLIRLCAVPDPYLRARLIIEFGVVAEPGGGPAADVLYEVALAYLALAGAAAPSTIAARLHNEVLEDLREPTGKGR